MIFVQCARGYVLWLVVQVDLDLFEFQCQADATAIQVPRTADASWGAAFSNVIQHSVSLEGTFQNAWFVPRVL
jgi:hypothetical protein